MGRVEVEKGSVHICFPPSPTSCFIPMLRIWNKIIGKIFFSLCPICEVGWGGGGGGPRIGKTYRIFTHKQTGTNPKWSLLSPFCPDTSSFPTPCFLSQETSLSLLPNFLPPSLLSSFFLAHSFLFPSSFFLTQLLSTSFFLPHFLAYFPSFFLSPSHSSFFSICFLSFASCLLSILPLFPVQYILASFLSYLVFLCCTFS